MITYCKWLHMIYSINKLEFPFSTSRWSTGSVKFQLEDLNTTLLIKAAQTSLTVGWRYEFYIFKWFLLFLLFFCRMEDFFALSKEEAPDNIPMMFITMPSAKDPEAKLRHPGTNTHNFNYFNYSKECTLALTIQDLF